MKIKNTELEYEVEDGHVLDYYLGRPAETKEEWAQRVWDCCRRHSEGEKIPRVYAKSPNQTWQDRAHELWENKKKKRKEAIMRHMKVSPSELSNIHSHPRYRKREQEEI